MEMKNYFFKNNQNLQIFKDSECETDFYAMGKEAFYKKVSIMKEYAYCKQFVPDNQTVDVYKIKILSGQEKLTYICEPLLNETVKFQVNRITSIWLNIIN
jgi:hypothetical protein